MLLKSLLLIAKGIDRDVEIGLMNQTGATTIADVRKSGWEKGCQTGLGIECGR
jgi:hypothetical protein